MGSWVPDPGGVTRVASMLLDGSSGSNEAQNAAYKTLRELAEHPEFELYLAYVLNAGAPWPNLADEQQTIVRQSAGLLLKNNLRMSYKRLSSQSREFIQTELLRAIGDTMPQIREVASLAAASVVAESGLKDWFELLPALEGYLKSGDEAYTHGSISTLCKLCEDAMERLDEDPEQPLLRVIPEMLKFLEYDNEDVRIKVIHAVNHMLASMPLGLQRSMKETLEALFRAANDSSDEVRKEFCVAICRLEEAVPEVLEEHMKEIVPYMIQTSQSSNEELALEACEFWCIYSEKPSARETLLPYAGDIVNVLMHNMIYSDTDPGLVDSEEDCSVPDRPEEIRPQFHTARSVSAGEAANSEANGGEPAHGADEDELSDWSVRKSSAAAFDGLATVFGDSLLDHLLPILDLRLRDSERWQMRESAVLALGACSEGCPNGMVPYLPDLVQQLVRFLSDDHHLVRSISCWALSRYSRWIVNQRDNPLSQNVFEALLVVLLDRNKRVQASACSALACFEEELGSDLVGGLELVTKAFAEAFKCYQRKNQLILYDAIGTMAECVESALAVPMYINTLMPPLIDKWNQLVDGDVGLLPLFECLTVVLKHLGKEASNFANPILSRCVSITKSAFAAASRSADYANALEFEFVICSLDLIAGIAEALGSSLELVTETKELPELVTHSMKGTRPDVRQSAYALLGDLARAEVSGLSEPEVMEVILAETLRGLDVRFVNVCNNATWALGELSAMYYRKNASSPFGPHLEAGLLQLITTLRSPLLTRSVLENTAITLGRVALIHTESLAPALGGIIEPMCLILRNIRDGQEKEDACRGMCAMVKLNPEAVGPSFLYFASCVASW
mmetsp:Transcript_42818/g.167320  ORF Transcript_42818/g.167320 Transcript_42818/m.167320 type:complete len:850 (-) Transcript_42818:1049-3598(-)